MIAAERQGSLDGLCGLYALTNLFCDEKVGGRFCFDGRSGSRREHAFEFIVMTAERLNMLSADYLLRGYDSYHLKLIADEIISAHGMEFTCDTFLKRCREKSGSFFQFAENILDKGGMLIFAKPVGHWVASKQMADKKIVVLNSDPYASANTNLTKLTTREVPMTLGLIIEPCTRNLTKVES